ncbi:MAG: VWA domain-containing protein [Candidatus Acidiferrales bacterium]
MIPRIILFVALCIPGVCPHVSRAQEPGPLAQPAIRSTTELVKVDAGILDLNGKFVGGLEQKNFRILDHGVERPILFFAPVEAPAQVIVMIETSPAVYLIHTLHLAAAYELLNGLAADDQVALVTYDEAPHAILPFTLDKSALAAAFDKIQFTLGTGQLNFFDSVSTVLDWVAPASGKKALVLLTTGLDSSPPARWDALVQKLRARDVVVYSVGLGGPLRQPALKKSKPSKKPPKSGSKQDSASRESENPLSFEKANNDLLELAAITGGRAYFPESAKDFAPMYREIASALRHQYVLGIAPEHDGKFHEITVEILDGNGPHAGPEVKRAEFRVLARQGFLAPGP